MSQTAQISEKSSEKSSVKTAKPVWKRSWFKWSASLLILFALFISLLPEAVRYGAVYVLKEQGMKQAQIENIDINLFSGEVGIYGVKISGDNQEIAQLKSLYINLAMQALIDKQIKLQSIKLNGFELDVRNSEQGAWIVAGFIPPPSQEESKKESPNDDAEPWGIAIEALQLSAIEARLNLPQLKTTVSINSLSLDNLASWQPESAAPLKAQLMVDGSPLTLESQLQPFLKEPLFKASIALEKLPLEYANGFLTDTDIKNLKGLLNIKTDVIAKITEQQPIVEADTTLQLSDVSLQQAQYKIAAKQINLKSEANYTNPTSEKDLGIRLKGQLGLTQFKLHDQQTKLTLADFQQLDIKKIQLAEAQKANVGSILLQKLKLLTKQKDDRLLTIGSTEINQISYDGDKAITIDSIGLSALDANIILKENGQIHLVDVIAPKQSEVEETTEQQSTNEEKTEAVATTGQNQEQAWQVVLNKFHLDENTHIKFEDQSIKPNFKAELTPFELTVTDIDTANKARAINVTANGIINQHEKIELEAEVKPFTEKLNATAVVKITALELPPLSPYVADALGYYLKRGQLAAEIDVAIKDDMLDTKVHAYLNKFNIEEGDPAKVESMTESLSMPLDVALNLLRDKNDNIKLDLTIDGNINDPQFDASKVINRAMAKATKAAVTTYLAHMLQPWGTLLTLVDIVGEATKMRFEPVHFNPADSNLNEDGKDYLSKIAGLMKERPSIQISLCGRVSKEDRTLIRQRLEAEAAAKRAEEEKNKTPEEKEQEALAKEAGEIQEPPPIEVPNETLLTLAIQRTKNSKTTLVEAGIDSSRLFTCQPDMDGVEKNKPIVDLSL